MIIIDYFNFLYCRYHEINESIIIANLKILNKFASNKNILIQIIFDGIYFQNINYFNKKIKLHFPSFITADDYIINLFSKLQGKSHILISYDKDLIKNVLKKSNPTILSPKNFWQDLDFLMQYTIIHDKKTPLIKTTSVEDDIDILFYNYFNKKI